MSSVIATGLISGTSTVELFFEDMSQNAARTITVIPQRQPPPQLPTDQQARLKDLYYILKGPQHPPGSGPNTLQLHVVVENMQGGEFNLQPSFLFYKVLMSES
ncbi:hypothetical protein ACFVSN_30135 [Kitasatospora sp. NPDC057904]|uniref:hypothetical protein n=1 Tax=Kitasatospora sp. NPDC057904 TaxID=3346275 RepID=UPI0036DE91C4